MTLRLVHPALAAIIYFVMDALSGSAYSETTREFCERTSPDNASLRRCMVEKTTEETTALTGKACSSKRCLIKMTTCKDIKETTICEGAGYTVSFVPIETGTEITIVDDKGRKTHLSRCGTCTSLDYDDGPLEDANIRYGAGFIVLDISK